jgi:periplasmic protein TonB
MIVLSPRLGAAPALAGPGQAKCKQLAFETTAAWRVRKNERRARRRAQLTRRVQRPVRRETLDHDPLVHDERRAGSSFSLAVLLLLASVAAHVLVVLACWGAGGILGGYETRRPDDRLAVAIVNQPPPEPTAPPPAPMPPQKVPETAIQQPDDSVTPPDPVDKNTPPPEKTPAQPVRRVIGLSMESTVMGGDGPAFAVGNTRMGQTADVAEAPDEIGTLPPEVTPPVRRDVDKPEYPPSLRAQGIEGEVKLEVAIDETGHVTRVSVIEPSSHDAFNKAAVLAAEKNTYESAKLNGVATTYIIRFTIRFRLRE